MKKYIGIVFTLFLVSCAGKTDAPEAYGNFEAKEILLPAQTNGILMSFQAEEGDLIEEGQLLGLVDTLSLHLKKLQLQSQIMAVLSKLNNIEAETRVMEKQLDIQEKERIRLENLVRDGASATKPLDDLLGNMEVLRLQIASVRTQTNNVYAEKAVLTAQLKEIDDQIRRSILLCPVQGTILEKYVEENEMVVAGKSLAKIGDLSVMYLKAFVGASQLDDLKTGQEVKVRFDRDEESDHILPGVLTWISSQAEFTPKIIQTKEERVSLVYAIKVRVENNGMLKVGMPGEVIF